MKVIRLLVLTLFIVSILAGPAHAGSLRAGAGRVDISPPKGLPLAGYGQRNIPTKKYNQGIHDPIYARALILEADGVRVGFVVTDTLMILKELHDELKSRVKDLGLDLLFLTATHTHSGMGGYLELKIVELAVMGPYSEQARKIYLDGTEKALREAWDNMQSASIGSAIGDAPRVTANRRHKGGVTDPDMGVIRVDDLRGRPLAFLLNFAIHPTLMPPSNLLISGDVTGRAEATLEQRHPGSIAMFINSGLGDQQPYVDWPEAEWRYVEEIGDKMAIRAEQISSGIRNSQDVSLKVYEREFEMPEVYLRPALSCWYGLNPLVKRMGQPMLREEGRIAGLLIGNDTLMLASPGELAYEIESHLASMFPDKKVFVMVHTNDTWGYVVTPEDYETGGYETCMNFYGKDFAPYLEHQYKLMIK